MKNKLVDLNNHLFEQIERLNDDELKGDALQEEINRSNAMTNVAMHIIANGKLALDAVKMQDNLFDGKTKLPAMLSAGE